MQLILESEPTLAIDREMSTVEDIQTEKVGNGDFEETNEKNCIGNKENIGDVNIITDDDEKKPVINEEDTDLVNLPIYNKSAENDDVESTIADTIKEENCEVNSPEMNDAQIEESQINGIDEDVNSVSTIDKEIETELKVTADEDIAQDEQDIISIKEEKEEYLNQTPNIVEKEPENIILQNDDTVVKEELPSVSLLENVIPQTDDRAAKEEPSIILLENNFSQNNETAVIEVPIAKDDVEVIEITTKALILDSETTSETVLEESNSKTTKTENTDKIIIDESRNVSETPNCDTVEIISSPIHPQESSPIELKDDKDDEEVIEETKCNNQDTGSQLRDTVSPVNDKILQVKDSTPIPENSLLNKPIVCKLSNTLDILSDDEEEPPKEETPMEVDSNDKQCINIEDDDDIMLIDGDTSKTETPQTVDISNKEETPINVDVKTDSDTGEKTVEEKSDLFEKEEEKEPAPPADTIDGSSKINICEKQEEIEIVQTDIPLLPDNFLKAAKKNLSDMTRQDLEEFCILKIVESIVDRSNLSEIKNKLKTMAQSIEEYRKKAMMLTKQNRDLQVVLKSVQEEQKKMTPDTPITPLKITRSVGMQVFMEKTGGRRKSLAQIQPTNNSNVNINRQNVRNASTSSPRPQKQPVNNQPIPVPRLVPANSPAIKTPSTIPLVNQITPTKTATPMPNGIKSPSPSQKVAEKRTHNRILSVTVDLTDDEPPTKINNRTSPAPAPVRLVPPQSLLAAPRQQFATAVNSPRKVYIPISGPQNQSIRPGQTIMLKTVPSPGLRPRGPTTQLTRVPSGSVRMNRVQAGRHPAPLPDAMKQYQPPNWKALPPAPDLKLSKVENGIVISWKIEGYQEDSYEEIASYQLYAYQETSSPPSTSLWKKIGDVKALPLPMACTLTQFMAGFKYYFAVRAVDIRSRLGPFSLPGSILLLNKL